MEAGRAFGPADDEAGAEGGAIVRHAFWGHQLSPDPQAVGRVLTLDGRSFTIVGILAEGLRYLRNYDVFVAMGAFAGERPLRERSDHNGYVALARLAPGVTEAAAA